MDYIKKVEDKISKEVNNFIGNKTYKAVMKKKLEYGLHKNTRPIVVSMASYIGRYKTIVPTLKSLICQSYKPDRIIVWLDDDNIENKITSQMKIFEEYGVEYRYTSDNLGPHKKYFYAMQEFKDTIVITVDDDLVYPVDLVKSLIESHEKYPDCICARRVHRMKFDSCGNVQPYKTWEYEYKREKKPSYYLCPTGAGGVLYPAGILPRETFDANKIKELCWYADDMWLKFMALKADVQTVWVPTRLVMPYEVEGSQLKALNTVNTNRGGNDEYIENILFAYPEIKNKILRFI